MVIICVLLSCHRSRVEAVYTVPIEYRKLENGLKVILSPDHSAPIVTVAVYYRIGSRYETRGRTGFAHLFEHMMFQGSTNLPKGQFADLIEGNGGFHNGITRFDFSGYYEVLPAHTLETVLWAEADRMRGLNITQAELINQQDVIVNEIKTYVINEPYGQFYWLEMPQYAYENWFNAHSFYGDLEDIRAATLEEVHRFYGTYYGPNNAALVVVGDFDNTQAFTWVKDHFGRIPSVDVPHHPDISEPRQKDQKRVNRKDRLAHQPALAFAYHLPERHTPEYVAFGILDQILLQGKDSRLYQALVKRHGVTGSVDGGINVLGNMFNYNGPTLWTGYLFHDSTVSADAILRFMDEEIERLRATPIDKAELERMRIKFRSDFYSMISRFLGIGLAEILACSALFDDDPGRINAIEETLGQVTPELILKTAREYLRPANRTVLAIEPEPNR
jgi:zinc protease